MILSQMPSFACSRGVSWMLRYCVTLSFICCGNLFAGDAVCKSRTLCYECNSTQQPLCGDPFNVSDAYQVVPLVECFGCCIKLAVYRTPSKKQTSSVVRTCSSSQQMEIDPKLIDRNCFGHIKNDAEVCFCDQDRCNGAASKSNFPTVLLSLSYVLILPLTLCYSLTMLV